MKTSRSVWLIAATILATVPVPSVAEHDLPHPLPPDAAKVEAFEKARTEGELLFDMASMYRKAGRVDDALATFRKIADLQIPVIDNLPQSRDAASKRLMIYAIMADMQREKKDYAGALKSLAEGQEKVAAATYLTPPMKLRAQVELLKAEAHIDQEQGDVDKAAAAFKKALSALEK